MTARPTITHYDFADIRYSSFYIAGFRHNASLYNYHFLISRTLASPLSVPVMASQWQRFVPSLLLFQFKSAAEDYYFCIDTSDVSLGGAYHLPLLQMVKYYFKVNYNREHVMNDANITPHSHKIVPILPFFPLRAISSLRCFPQIAPHIPMAWNCSSRFRRVIDTITVPSLDRIRVLRSSRKLFDIFFLTSYYPEQHHAKAMELRLNIMEQLEKQRFSNAFYGFASRNQLPKPYSRYAVDRLVLSKYMNSLARSRVAIYVRGLHDCISFKFGEYLALGLPVVGQTIMNNRENLMRLPYFGEQFAFDDARDIVLEAAAMLGRDDRRLALGKSNAEFFETMLSPGAVTADALERLGLRRCSAKRTAEKKG